MELPRNRFKALIRSGSTAIGTWHTLGSHAVLEALGLAGFDFLVVDMEHGQYDVPQVIDQLRVIAGTPASSIVRLPWNDAVMVKRVLETGAQTLMFPFVQNVDEARRAIAATRYPPEGIRGVAALYRSAGYGLIRDYLHVAASELCVILQLETADAVERLEEIAALPGLDALFIGPADLSATMGHLGNPNHPAVKEKLRWAAQTCRRLGMPCGIIALAPETIAEYLDFGFSWIAANTDVSMLLGGAASVLASTRTAAAKTR